MERMFVCPTCGKHRMVRPHDHVVSYEKREVENIRGETVSLYKDVCSFCETKIIKKHFTPTKKDTKRVMSALKNQTKLEEGQSLEDML